MTCDKLCLELLSWSQIRKTPYHMEDAATPLHAQERYRPDCDHKEGQTAAEDPAILRLVNSQKQQNGAKYHLANFVRERV